MESTFALLLRFLRVLIILHLHAKPLVDSSSDIIITRFQKRLRTTTPHSYTTKQLFQNNLTYAPLESFCQEIAIFEDTVAFGLKQHLKMIV
jgi:hypothetical protein